MSTVVSAKECMLVCVQSVAPPDKADRTDSHLPTECRVSTFSLSYFKAAGCQQSTERRRERIERCFCFGWPTGGVRLCPADLQFGSLAWYCYVNGADRDEHARQGSKTEPACGRSHPGPIPGLHCSMVRETVYGHRGSGEML